jgi:hypothetical protein
MTKSEYALAVDRIQAHLSPFLKDHGFRRRGRTFNGPTGDGLTRVVSIQMGASDPPGTTYIPGLRENLHGLFTVNLGVYVPEVARHHGGGEAKSWMQEYHCCIRSRLGAACGEPRDVWWPARADEHIIEDIRRCLELFGLPFLDRFATRDRILAEWAGRSENLSASSPPRIVLAIILLTRGRKDEARALLSLQASETHNARHPESVRGLATRLGLGGLDGR